MRLLHCLWLMPVCMFPACGGTSDEDTPAGKPTFEGDELDAVAADLVTAHNAVRAAVEPAADPALPPLSWDDALARTAQDWSDACVFEHSGKPFGENLAFFSGIDASGTDVVQLWGSEAVDYSYAANTCRPGAQCGHYTQLVWRDTAKVGCGISDCNIQGSDGTYWVCNYDPPGNFIGERPY